MKVLASKLLVVATLLTGLALNTQGADKQTLCPLMIEDEIDVEEFVTYKGVKVFVCCGTCKKMWAQNPDYYAVVSKKQAPQLAKVASKEIKPMKQLFCPVYSDTRVHPKSPSIEHNGKKIYFCKTRAVTRFKSNPAKYEKNLPK
jgi:YHS domain-containing protein|tara:strand:- start:40 stop:471 length:432 start_codon:yes stop_codon:yes gene_type:complete